MLGKYSKIVIGISGATIFFGFILFTKSINSQSVFTSGGGVSCDAIPTNTRLDFNCSSVGQMPHALIKDTYGAVIKLQSEAELEIKMGSTGTGKTMARLGSLGEPLVVDPAGNVTHRDYSAESLLSYPNKSSSIAVVGSTDLRSKLTVDLTSPISETTSGRAVIITGSNDITLNVSGKDGASGRSAETAAAFQVLRGELGTSDDIKGLVENSMNLSNSLSEPSLSALNLSGNVGRCEDVSAIGVAQNSQGLSRLQRPETSEDGETVSAFVKTAREMQVGRTICERQTAEEFSVQTVCSREPEISIKLRCEYPDLVNYNYKFKRPREAAKTAFECAQSVQTGIWNTDCAKEEFAVASSVLKPRFFVLAPSKSIVKGMSSELLHHYPRGAQITECQDPNSPACRTATIARISLCGVDNPGLWGFNSGSTQLYRDYVSLPSINGPQTYSFTFAPDGTVANPLSGEFYQYNFDTKIPGGNASIAAVCGDKSYTKMEKLMATGALVKPHSDLFLPGSSEEGTTLVPSISSGTNQNITKLSYWARGSDREPTDNLNTTPASNENTPLRPAAFSSLDPSVINPSDSTAAAEKHAQRNKFFNKLIDLGFDRPQVEDALLSYKELSAKHEVNDLDLKSILCSGDKAKGGALRAGNQTNESICSEILKPFPESARNLKFRNKITYEFSELSYGLNLKRKMTDLSPEVFYRAVTSDAVSFIPRALFLPGDLDIQPVTKVSYCKEIEIDNDPVLLQSGSEYDFYGPEKLSGAGIATYKSYFNGASYEEQMQSAQALVEQNTAQFQKAPTRILYGFSQSFLKVTKKTNLKNQACESVSINHSVSSHEKEVITKLKNGGAVLVISEGSKIEVYYSPLLIPRSNMAEIVPESRMYLNTGLPSGLLVPEINVAPAMLENVPGPLGPVLNGYGAPKRMNLDIGLWSEPNGTDNQSRLSADFANSVSYLGLPPRSSDKPENRFSKLNGPGNIYILPQYDQTGTRNLDGSAVGTSLIEQIGPRKLVGSTLNLLGAQRLIKTLRKYHLGVSFSGSAPTPTLSPTFVEKKNTRTFSDVLLAQSVGVPSSGAADKKCLPQNIVNNFHYPTKLISRKIEPLSAEAIDSEDPETNFVVDTEVSSVSGATFNLKPDEYHPYFSRAFVPTTMITKNFYSPDEPSNIAQDYNHFLAQVQQMSGLSRYKGSSIQFEEERSRTDSSKIPYFARVTAERTIKLYQEIARRKRYLPEFDKTEPVIAGDRTSIISYTLTRASKPGTNEKDCITENPQSGQTPSDLCISYDSSDIYRRYRPSHMFLNIPNVQSRTIDYKKDERCVAVSETDTVPNNLRCKINENDLFPTGRYEFTPVSETFYSMSNSKPSPFYPVRPWKKIYRGYSDLVENEAGLPFHADPGGLLEAERRWLVWRDGASVGPETPTSGKSTWLTDPDVQINYDYFSGHFLPLLRTGQFIFAPNLISAQNPKVHKDLSSYFDSSNSPTLFPRGLDNPRPFITNSEIKQYLSSSDGPFIFYPDSSPNYYGGLHLPSISVRSKVRLGRFITAMNQNCTLYDIKRDFGSNWKCTNGGNDRSYTAGFAMFYGDPSFGSSNLMSDVHAAQSNYNPIAENPQTDENDGYIAEKAYDGIVGISGYMFTGCEDNFAADRTIPYGHNTVPSPINHTASAATVSPEFQESTFPIGLKLSPFGGLFYGPLVGEDLVPANNKEHDNERNFLYVQYNDIAARTSKKAPVYLDDSIVGKILSSTSQPVVISKSSVEGLPVTKTLGRTIIDAQKSLSLESMQNNPAFYYEPHVALIPEVLAALFLHGDFSDNENQRFDTLNPFDPNISDEKAKPQYFAKLLSPFISKALLQDLDVTFTNASDPVKLVAVPYGRIFKVDSKRFDLPFSSGAVGPFILSYKDAVVDFPLVAQPAINTIKIAWEITNASLYMDVSSYGLTDSQVTASSVSIARGSAILYGAGGSSLSGFGGIDDQTTYVNYAGDTVTSTRQVGLADKNVREAKLSLTPDDSQSVDGFPIRTFVNLVNIPQSVSAAHYFAESVCGQDRASVLPNNGFAFEKPSSTDGFVGDYRADSSWIRPYDLVCLSAAVRARPSEAKPCFGSSGSGCTPVIPKDPVLPLTGQTKTGAEDNVYWELIRNDVTRTVVSSTDPTSPPSCPVGERLLSQQFVLTSPSTAARSFNILSTSSGLWSSLPEDPSTGEKTCPACGCSNSTYSTQTTCENGGSTWFSNANCDPGEPFVEIGRTYTPMFDNENLCYDTRTGTAITDTRTNKSNPICQAAQSLCSLNGFATRTTCEAAGGIWAFPSGFDHTAAVFVATSIETSSQEFTEVGLPPPSSPQAPGGALAAYTIPYGTTFGARRKISDIYPQATVIQPGSEENAVYEASTDTYWIKASQSVSSPQCRPLNFDPLSGTIDPSNQSLPILRPISSYTEKLSRFGVLDSFIAKTKSKQIRLPVSGQASGVDAFLTASADVCDFSSNEAETSFPVVKSDVQPSSDDANSPPSLTSMNYVVDYIINKGASSGLTTRQATPWSTERNDGIEGVPPSCEIFDDEDFIGQERNYEFNLTELSDDRLFTFGEGGRAQTFKMGHQSSVDTSLNAQGKARFVVGGSWIPVGIEERQLTADTPLFVECRFQIDSANGSDGCDAPIPITYETVEGFSVTIRAEDGEHGGHSGSAVVLTSLPAEKLTLSSTGGAGGVKGSEIFSGATADRNLICYETSTDSLSPWIRLYRFNKALLQVAPGSNGNSGQGGSDKILYGWGIMPEAASFLEKQLIDSATKSSGN